MDGIFTTINRPYKERGAQETIAIIRDKLAALDLLPDETFHANPYPGLYSVSLELPQNKGCSRSNGKGRSSDFSLASAYAEFVERMQNGLFALFPRTIVTELQKAYGFYYSPDERYLDTKELKALPDPIVSDIVRYSGAGRLEFMSAYLERVKANGASGVVAVPFYDTQNRRVAYIPFNLLLLTVGSNGMAAGNTQAEAIFQALCELLERWGAAEVFYNQFTPPTVPRKYLRQFKSEYGIIREIERSGKYKITVKDFSAKRRIPSLGLIIENRQNNTYRLNVGSDTCFEVALSRCLTEVYQGVTGEQMFDACALPIAREEAPYFINDDEESLRQRYMVFAKFTKDNSGPFPIRLFGRKPDYTFDPTVWTQRASYTEEVQRLIAYFHSMGSNVYIRDVSFLGFPSVFVYVPEISAEGRKNVPPPALGDTPIMLELDRIESKALRLKSCSDDDLLEIVPVLERFSASTSLPDLFGLKLREDSPWKQVNLGFILTEIWYRLGKLEEARASFQKFLETRALPNPYYAFASLYLEKRAEGLSAQEALETILHETEEKELASQVGEDLADPSRAMCLAMLPNCPDCDACELRGDCITVGKVATARVLYPAMQRARVDQEALSWVC